MKKLLMVALAMVSGTSFASSIESASSASRSGLYIGGDIGRTNLTGSAGKSSSSNQYGLLGGLDLYTSQSTVLPTTFAVEVGVNRSKLEKGSPFYNYKLSFVPKIYLNSNLGLIGRIGYGMSNFKNGVESNIWSEKFKRSVNFGIGVEYQLTPEISARLTFDQSRKSGLKQNSTLAALTYKF